MPIDVKRKRDEKEKEARATQVEEEVEYDCWHVGGAGEKEEGRVNTGGP